MQCYVYVMHHLILLQNTANSDVRVRRAAQMCKTHEVTILNSYLGGGGGGGG